MTNIEKLEMKLQIWGDSLNSKDIADVEIAIFGTESSVSYLVSFGEFEKLLSEQAWAADVNFIVKMFGGE